MSMPGRTTYMVNSVNGLGHVDGTLTRFRTVAYLRAISTEDAQEVMHVSEYPSFCHDLSFFPE